MYATRPFGLLPFRTVPGDLDRLFQGFWNGLERGSLAFPRTGPALNVWENDEALYAELELPGVKLEDLDVTVHGRVLSVRGERRAEVAEEGVTTHRRERPIGAFQRTVQLPADVDAEKVEARLEHGVLMLTLPKQEAARPRKIEIRTR